VANGLERDWVDVLYGVLFKWGDGINIPVL
jgi:hypothetical protein